MLYLSDSILGDDSDSIKYIKLKYGTVSKLGGTPYWVVDKPFYWLFDYEEKNGYAVTVEEGFKTDFGSIPRLLWVFLNPTEYNSYVFHDAFYKSQMKYHIGRDEYVPMTRYEADCELIEGLMYEGATTFERLIVFAGVRLFGWYKWR